MAASPSLAHPAHKAEPTAHSPTARKGGGGGKSREESGRRAFSAYEAKVATHLRHYRSYPAEAQRQGVSGVAVVRFTANRNGSVSAATLVRSSGHRVLDQEAIAMVRRASPFPPVPQDVPGSRVTLSAPIDFRLR